MTNIIYCQKLKKDAPALQSPPFPGELGEKILNHICQEAWNMWLSHQTMLINEYRLNLIEPQARSFLRQEMQNFLFGDGSELPPGYTEKKS